MLAVWLQGFDAQPIALLVALLAVSAAWRRWAFPSYQRWREAVAVAVRLLAVLSGLIQTEAEWIRRGSPTVWSGGAADWARLLSLLLLASHTVANQFLALVRCGPGRRAARAGTAGRIPSGPTSWLRSADFAMSGHAWRC